MVYESIEHNTHTHTHTHTHTRESGMGKWKASETVAVNGAKNAGSSSICAVPSKVYDGQMSYH